MRLLRVINYANPANGGPIEHIRQITPELSARGHETELVCLDDPNAPWLNDLPCVVHPLGEGWTGYNISPVLRGWLKRNCTRFDWVIVHGLWQFVNFAVWSVLGREKTPYLVYPHGMLDPWFKEAYPRKHLAKYLSWLIVEHHLLRDAAGVVFTSEEEKRLSNDTFVPYCAHKFVVSYGTADPRGDVESQLKKFYGRFPDLEHRRILLFLSRIHPKKGCDLLIEAFSRVESSPEMALVFAGPDETGWRDELELLAERRGVADRITWTGMLTGDLKWGAYRAAEVFCLPSHQENFGIVVAEALACGVPVLTTTSVNIWRELLEDEVGLVDRDDEDGVTRLLQNWLELSEQDRAEMGRRARISFRNRFEIGRVADSLVRVLKMEGRDTP